MLRRSGQHRLFVSSDPNTPPDHTATPQGVEWLRKREGESDAAQLARACELAKDRGMALAASGSLGIRGATARPSRWTAVGPSSLDDEDVRLALSEAGWTRVECDTRQALRRDKARWHLHGDPPPSLASTSPPFVLQAPEDAWRLVVRPWKPAPRASAAATPLRAPTLSVRSPAAPTTAAAAPAPPPATAPGGTCPAAPPADSAGGPASTAPPLLATPPADAEPAPTAPSVGLGTALALPAARGQRRLRYVRRR